MVMLLAQVAQVKIDILHMRARVSFRNCFLFYFLFYSVTTFGLL